MRRVSASTDSPAAEPAVKTPQSSQATKCTFFYKMYIFFNFLAFVITFVVTFDALKPFSGHQKRNLAEKCIGLNYSAHLSKLIYRPGPC